MIKFDISNVDVEALFATLILLLIAAHSALAPGRSPAPRSGHFVHGLVAVRAGRS